ncbi:hypothetical protein EV715DRAFT_298108, partial [Schizophyllum commune]
MPDPPATPPSSAGRRPLRHRLLPSWIIGYFSRGRPSSSAPMASSAVASSTRAPGDDLRGPQSHPRSPASTVATSPSASPSHGIPGLRERLSISKLYRRLSRSLAPSSRGSPPSPVRSPEPEPASSALQVPPSSPSTDGMNLDPPTGSLPPPRGVEACETAAPSTDVSDALSSTSAAVVDVADAPVADPMTKMWNEAVA